MLRFYLTRGKIAKANELANKTYLTIKGVTGFVKDDEPYYILQASQN